MPEIDPPFHAVADEILEKLFSGKTVEPLAIESAFYSQRTLLLLDDLLAKR
jgi:hypothetical protein